MAGMNTRRVLLGAVAGGAVWTLWTMVINVAVLSSQYAAAQQAGHLLKEPRYPLFLVYWIITLFLVSFVLAWLYAGVRATCGAGPRTALLLGLRGGFAVAFPLSLSVATWAPWGRTITLWWMIDLWGGAVLATFVAGWLYKD
mgnify:CR=1 FL=1